MLGSALAMGMVLAEGISIGIMLEKSGYRKKITDSVVDKYKSTKRKIINMKLEQEYKLNPSLSVFSDNN